MFFCEQRNVGNAALSDARHDAVGELLKVAVIGEAVGYGVECEAERAGTQDVVAVLRRDLEDGVVRTRGRRAERGRLRTAGRCGHVRGGCALRRGRSCADGRDAGQNEALPDAI